MNVYLASIDIVDEKTDFSKLLLEFCHFKAPDERLRMEVQMDLFADKPLKQIIKSLRRYFVEAERIFSEES